MNRVRDRVRCLYDRVRFFEVLHRTAVVGVLGRTARHVPVGP